MAKSTASFELGTGEKLKWDIEAGECSVWRPKPNGGEDMMATFTGLNTQETKVNPRDGLSMITPACVKEVRRLFPSAKLGRQHGKKREKRTR